MARHQIDIHHGDGVQDAFYLTNKVRNYLRPFLPVHPYLYSPCCR
jgi:acetoin utilization deacetylase AcuC-like enzyme